MRVWKPPFRRSNTYTLIRWNWDKIDKIFDRETPGYILKEGFKSTTSKPGFSNGQRSHTDIVIFKRESIRIRSATAYISCGKVLSASDLAIRSYKRSRVYLVERAYQIAGAGPLLNRASLPDW